MIARDFASPARGIDRGFIARQRARGTPEHAIARMGGWCLVDVQAVPHDPRVLAFERPKPALTPRPTLAAYAIPDVAEILHHVAEQYEISAGDILGHSHSQEIVPARHEAFAVVYELNRFTLRQLGQIFNKTDTAILYGLRRHYERLRRPEREW